MKLSILDQSPISANQTPQDALIESMKLAQTGEEYGYTRYWIAEHHDLPGLACPTPEVVLGYIGAHTNRIRIGSGAVLLPHYRPYKVAEAFNTLATLFPDRIDLGIGRAPGGSAEATNALSTNFLKQTWDMPNLVKELIHFLNDNFPEGHEYEKVSASPIPENPPIAWLLGTSEKSALLAAENGLPYTFGQFMSDKNGAEIIQTYLERFQPRRTSDRPEVIVTVSAFCAETTEKAEVMALTSIIWGIQREKNEGNGLIPSTEEAMQYKLTPKEKEVVEKRKQQMIIGTPRGVKERLIDIQSQYHTDEIMIVTNTYSTKDRVQSYKLIAEEIL
ncbi:LLM class flavin-dependent oxidoreductase [Bacillus sp. FJAT-45350]|uniref:LLM class flavin-dependent oxidoreductase n=1 Tax=Bacillus sp. FJAT-45350 TaxID=2011014 RepID=UPI000BB88E6A|nr:LLM class flavin-dependent oxidoreductase [Bacillus sp. FJAT-45350]